jgi:hypothetical protein
MPLYDVPDAGINVCNDVRLRCILGVLVDSALSFEPLLAEVLSRGWALFDKVFFTAETCGFSIPVLSAQVPLRVETAVLFAAPFLCLAPRAEFSLNRMQVASGRRRLGCQTGPHIKWMVVLAQCGWTMRLGTRMLERAIMTKARASLLPAGHPVARMLRLAESTMATSWVSAVKLLMNDQKLPSEIPEVMDMPFCTEDKLQQARGDRVARKLVLSEYKWVVVRPILLEYDRLAYHRTVLKELPVFGVPFTSLVPVPRRPSMDLLMLDDGPSTWSRFRLWALVRMSGCWPLPIYGGESLPEYVDSCLMCGTSQVSVGHMLCDCVMVAGDRSHLCGVAGIALPCVSKRQFVLELFKDDATPHARSAHIRFVAAAVGPAVRFLVLGAAGPGDDAPKEDCSSPSLSQDVLCRLEKERSRDYFEVPKEQSEQRA